MKSDPFRDEVAIDFPAMRRYVGRVRAGLLADEESSRSHVLKTEVRVSSTQAYLGTIVPIEIPYAGTCAVCGGRGETWSEPCHLCAGSGETRERHFLRVPVPSGVAHGARLVFRFTPPHAASFRLEIRVAISKSQDLRI